MLLLQPLTGLSQAGRVQVTGTVTDSSGSGISSVTVTEKGTRNAGATNNSGDFTISVAGPGSTLEFTSVGFISKQVVVGTGKNISVVLQQTDLRLNEVVVVGYGTQRKRDLTGSVQSIKSDDLNEGVATSAAQLLKGKAAGVEVVQNSSEPGGGVSISIRGASSINAGTGPLYVIDGLPINNSPPITATGANYVATPSPRDPLSSINPADIESIEILKDASATAIYGARGANGVILVTTRKGRAGRFTVTADSYYGVQNVTKKLPLLSPQEYMTAMNELQAAGASNAGERVTRLANGGTDWQDKLYRKNAGVQSHNLSFSGGSEKTNYFLSLNYMDQDGVVVTSGFTRYSARLNLNHKATERFEIGMNLNTAYTRDDFVPEGFGFNENAGALYAAFNFDPSLAVYDSAGNYVRSNFINIDNPLALAYGKNASAQTFRTYGSMYGQYSILPGLAARINLGGDVLNSRRDVYINRSTLDGASSNGIATILNGQLTNSLLEATLNYTKESGIHRLTALAGASTQKFANISSGATGRRFPSDFTQTDNLGAANSALSTISSSKSNNKLISFIGRVNYALKDRYLFTATFRSDGSTRFGETNKFGYFPSFALGWNLDEENFMKRVKTFSTIKLRASWGRTGNQEIGNYNSISTYTPGNDIVYNNQPFSTQAPSRLPNPNLKWETTEQLDFGLDFGLLQDRVTASIDYYRKSTFDMLLQLPVPTTTGFTSTLTNIGSIRNTGLELNLNSRNLVGGFKWNTNINLATIRNRVTDLGGIRRIITGEAGPFATQISLIEVGKPLNSFYGYQVAGVWQTGDDFTKTQDKVLPGDLKYVDINGDKIVNAADRVVLGNSFPKLSWSLRNNFTFRNVGLEIFFEGLEGVRMYNNNLAETYFPINFRRNRYAEPILKRWTPTNPSNLYPSFITPLSQGSRYINSSTVEDASYLRLKTATLSYVLPKFKGFQSVMVYVSGQNLWTLTDYKGMDPAVNPNGNTKLRIDWNAYPLATTYILGIKLGL
jgi:TonB-linked SusC/RagA family outer membrane protein